MWTENKLDALLSQPSEALIEDIKALSGDIILLGAGGKVGPNLALMAKRAVQAAGVKKRVIAVSRFSDPIARGLLENNGIETISADLLEEGALEKLPDAENVVYLAGRKFGTGDSACLTWAMNAALPTLVSRRYKGARIVAFSTGNVYPFMPVASGGADESVAPSPIGEYAMSSLARERVFEYAAREYGSRVLLLRLNYAVDLRYGVLYDLAKRMLGGRPSPSSRAASTASGRVTSTRSRCVHFCSPKVPPRCSISPARRPFPCATPASSSAKRWVLPPRSPAPKSRRRFSATPLYASAISAIPPFRFPS